MRVGFGFRVGGFRVGCLGFIYRFRGGNNLCSSFYSDYLVFGYRCFFLSFRIFGFKYGFLSFGYWCMVFSCKVLDGYLVFDNGFLEFSCGIWNFYNMFLVFSYWFLVLVYFLVAFEFRLVSEVFFIGV